MQEQKKKIEAAKEKGMESDEDFINEHYQIMHLDTLIESSQSNKFKRKATTLKER